MKRNVALGGTFEPLHEGHKRLIEVAVNLGEVVIGVTNDRLARTRLRSVLPFKIRAENVRRYIKKNTVLSLKLSELMMYME